MWKTVFLFMLISPAFAAQVVDVNKDDTVGAEEALAVAENWKGAASASNEHDHLGQTWDEDEKPLRIQGRFTQRVQYAKDGKGLQLKTVLLAPLMLDNEFSSGADLRLQGTSGRIAAEDETNSSMALISNRSFTFVLDADRAGFDDGSIQVRSGDGLLKFLITDEGSVHAYGNILADGTITGSNIKIEKKGVGKNGEDRIYYPLRVTSDSTHLLSGRAVLGEGGGATIHLPEEDAMNLDESHFQLTAMGSPSPNLHIAEVLQEEPGFAIAGGREGQEVCWQIVGRIED